MVHIVMVSIMDPQETYWAPLDCVHGSFEYDCWDKGMGACGSRGARVADNLAILRCTLQLAMRRERAVPSE